MLIDAHVHVYPPEFARGRARLGLLDAYFADLYASPKAHMARVEELIASMDESGVDRAVLAAFGWRDAGLCREHNAYTLDCVRRYPERLCGLVAVNPTQGDVAERDLVMAIESGLMGIGELMPDAGAYCIDWPGIAGLIGRVAAHYDVPVLLHTSEPVGHQYPGKGSVSLASVIRFATMNPDVRLVCAHWGGGLPFYELMPEVRRALARTYYDTAAWPLLYEDGVFAVAQRLVPGKVLFGTDYPLVSQAKAVARIRACGLAEPVLEEVLGATAAQVFCWRS